MRGTTQASGVVGPSESTISSKEGLEEAPGSRQGKDQKHKEFIEMKIKKKPFIILIKNIQINKNLPCYNNFSFSFTPSAFHEYF
jgi:hypothetical protein